MKCVILQPSYFPWRGYFHQIQKADLFIFYDDAQYDKHGWRNRNRIKARSGWQWLTIPVKTRGVVEKRIATKDIAIDWTTNWAVKHWRSIAQSYAKAPYFRRYADRIDGLLAERPMYLSEFTTKSTIVIASLLGISTARFINSSTLAVQGTKTDRLVNILRAVGATHYISGPSARDYLEEGKLAAAGIRLEYMVYEYPEYPQLYAPFDPRLSILDLLFMTGPDAPQYIWEARSASDSRQETTPIVKCTDL